MKIGSREFDCNNQTHIFGILNVTPDSFSDGGKFDRVDQALFRVEEMLDEGMDVLDIGGESTRPGYQRISVTEEISRILPIITAIKQHFDVPVSVDTYKPEVAEAVLSEGADLINDIWGLRFDERMADVISKAGAACCLMHNRMDSAYTDFMADVKADLRESISLARAAGIAKEKILIDPGIGFAKNLKQNLYLTNHVDALAELGYPILLGASRKSMIGNTLLLPVEEREEGTLATTVLAVMRGCAFVRVHNVQANARAIRMTRAMLCAKL